MTNELTKTELGSLLSFANGRTSPDRAEGLPYPVYGSNGVIGYASEANANANSIIIGRVGSYCGSLYLSKQRCWVTDNAIRATAREGNDPRFLFYLLCTLNLNNWRVGSGQPLLNQDILSRIPTAVPEFTEQRAIADVLAALDDKIERNRQTAQTLEQLAHAIFRAWFIDFEPVKAKANGATIFDSMPQAAFDTLPEKLVADSKHPSFGPVPEGWGVKPISAVFEINPSRKLRKGELAPYLDMKNMPTVGHAPDKWVKREFGSGMKFVNGDTLLARITPCLENGKTALVDFLIDGQVGWGSTEYIVLRPRSPLPAVFGYCLARATEFRDHAIQNMRGTSGRQRVAPDALDHFYSAIPEERIASAFGEVVQPMFDCIRAGMNEVRRLAELRDYLLPKLLSREVRVNVRASDAEATI